MSAGTSLPTVKALLVSVLSARSGLSGVPVTIGGPVSAQDLQNDSGTFEAVWIGDAETEDIEPPFLGVPVVLDENYTVDVVVQVLKAGVDADTQANADIRAAAILGEAVGALSADPSLGFTPTSTLLMLEALPKRWEHKAGWLGKGDGRGSRFVVKVAVYSRIAIT